MTKQAKPQKPNKCKCGSTRPRVQDHGDFAFVKCPDCLATTEWHYMIEEDGMEYKDNALEDWNTANPIDLDHPTDIEVLGDEIEDWDNRDDVKIATMERIEATGRWRLTLNWRQ